MVPHHLVDNRKKPIKQMQIQIQTQIHPLKELAASLFCEQDDDHLANGGTREQMAFLI